MAFDRTLMSKLNISLTESKVGVVWVYGPSTDNIATITASGFFDLWFDQVSKQDMLYIAASDGEDIRSFSNATGVKPVTVASFITAGDISDGAVTEPKIAPNSLTALVVGNTLAGTPIGSIPILFRERSPGGATNDVDILMTHKVEVIDAWTVNVDGGTTGDTITVQNVTTDITNAIDVNAIGFTQVRSNFITTSTSVISAGTNLRIRQVDGAGGDSPRVDVYVLAIRVA